MFDDTFHGLSTESGLDDRMRWDTATMKPKKTFKGHKKAERANPQAHGTTDCAPDSFEALPTFP